MHCNIKYIFKNLEVEIALYSVTFFPLIIKDFIIFPLSFFQYNCLLRVNISMCFFFFLKKDNHSLKVGHFLSEGQMHL